MDRGSRTSRRVADKAPDFKVRGASICHYDLFSEQQRQECRIRTTSNHVRLLPSDESLGNIVYWLYIVAAMKLSGLSYSQRRYGRD